MEHRVQSSSDPSLQLYLRERRPANLASRHSVPLLLVHGATIPSVLWDNPLPGWSWMDRLAMDGFHVFAVDLRGYGRSSQPESFDHPPHENAPYARAGDVTQDVIDAIDFILARSDAMQVDLLGGSWGSIICGKLVAENPKINIRRLVLYAPLYSETQKRPDWLSTSVAPLAASLGAYRNVAPEQLKHRWDAEIPVQDKSLWRPDGILEALTDNCIEDDNRDGHTGRPDFRVPNGTIADLHEVYDGKPLYNSNNINVPTLLIRGSHDPVSTHEDASRLLNSLKSNVKRYVVVENGAHFMIAENKIDEVHASITGFLAETS
ncbi:MAG: alpha/beta fold hydrolase [Rhizobiaceae bacterium]|nr:alpha/beta fold hydrolase [Rhizobiaceae bacterium]